ncbi:glutathione binding-like protein [Paenirhodobacter sp.]|uniref:glutathione binding-like protein n=1 Tax=Paenirhodobacter sp. TaxID=1965326 RepID=UPI003B3EE376
MLHLAEGTPLLPEGRRAEVTQWLIAALNIIEFASAAWMDMVLAGRMPEFFGPPPPAEVVEHARRTSLTRLDALEPLMADRGWIAGDFSVADIIMADVLRLVETEGQLGDHPALSGYVARAIARPAFGRAMADIAAAGGEVRKAPEDIPGTGRYAVVADPQGAVFGLLQPDMSQMSEAEAGEGAFNQKKPGHGNWNELMSTDPEAAFAFYAGLFGWTRGEAMDMGKMGTYQLFRRNGVDIGAMMGLGDAPMPVWLPYFGVDGAVTNVIEDIRTAGGTVHHGPMEVPGPAWIAVAQDPQGAWFAIVGTER